eukprot:scaffold23515_cov57-Phaeocystis_antarctica.AAC.2
MDTNRGWDADRFVCCALWAESSTVAADEELALPHVPRLARIAPVDGLRLVVAVVRRRQRRHRLLGDGVTTDNDGNGPLREGALRRGVPQGEQQLGRLGVAPSQLLEEQGARAHGLGGDTVDGRDEARLVLADDELHVRVRGELERARRHARAHPLAEGVGRDRRRAARPHLPEARVRLVAELANVNIAELGGALVRAKVEQAPAGLDDHARRLLEEAPAAVAV